MGLMARGRRRAQLRVRSRRFALVTHRGRRRRRCGYCSVVTLEQASHRDSVDRRQGKQKPNCDGPHPRPHSEIIAHAQSSPQRAGLTAGTQGPRIISMQRVGAILLAALVVLNGLAATADCAGWQSSASERMACCLEAGDACPDQLSADECCARSEQTQQPTLTTGSTVLPAPVAVGVTLTAPSSIWLPQPAGVTSCDRAIQKRPHTPTYLRNSVLLI